MSQTFEHYDQKVADAMIQANETAGGLPSFSA